MANKLEDVNGFYLMKFHEEEQFLEYIIKWNHKLPIDDADMTVMTTKWSQKKSNHSHIVCSFKK